MLKINRLSVSADSKPILRQVSLTVKPGEIHTLMGPNGSGKTSLAQTLMGHPHYQIDSGSITLNGKSLLSLPPNSRAHLGLFMAFQTPVSIPGISLQNVLKSAYEAIHCSGCQLHPHCPKLSVSEFRHQLQSLAQSINLDPNLLSQPLNANLSGGEKKRVEVLSLLILKPRYLILDELDSGLDVDSLRLLGRTLYHLAHHHRPGILLISHYHRFLDHLKPDTVSVLINGQIMASGGPELALKIDQHGYQPFRQPL